MGQKRKQDVLRQELLFRFFMLTVSLVIMIGYIIWSQSNPTLWGVALGFAGSSFAWAVVEMIDFFIEVQDQYENERIAFWSVVDEHLTKIRELLRKNKKVENVPWNKVNDEILNLYDAVRLYSFHGGVYSISEEYELIFNYVNRLNWKSSGCVKIGVQEQNEESVKLLYDSLVIIDEEKDFKNIRTYDEIVKNQNELKNIQISFDPIKVSKEHYIDSFKGNLYEYVDYMDGVVKYYTFRPDVDIDNEIYKKRKDYNHKIKRFYIIDNVLKLVFRHIEIII